MPSCLPSYAYLFGSLYLPLWLTMATSLFCAAYLFGCLCLPLWLSMPRSLALYGYLLDSLCLPLGLLTGRTSTCCIILYSIIVTDLSPNSEMMSCLQHRQSVQNNVRCARHSRNG